MLCLLEYSSCGAADPPEHGKYRTNLCRYGGKATSCPSPGLSDRRQKAERAGLDYWDKLDISYYDNIDDFFEKNSGGNYFFFTTKGRKIHSDAEYPDNSFLIFGREDAGLPEELLYAHPDECVRIPMRSTLRSLNLSNSAAIAVYEVLRQWGYPDLETKGQLTKFSW